MDRKLTSKGLLTILQFNPEPKCYLPYFTLFMKVLAYMSELLLLNKRNFKDTWEF